LPSSIFSSAIQCTYVLYIILGEIEWVLDINEGCVETYEDSAVVVIGFWSGTCV
jgi:hypothetical protein